MNINSAEALASLVVSAVVPVATGDMSNAQAWASLIAIVVVPVATAAALIITALRKVAAKADVIHTVVNSAMTELRTKNDLLMSMLNAKELERAAAESARIKLAEAAAVSLINQAAAIKAADTPKPS